MCLTVTDVPLDTQNGLVWFGEKRLNVEIPAFRTCCTGYTEVTACPARYTTPHRHYRVPNDGWLIAEGRRPMPVFGKRMEDGAIHGVIGSRSIFRSGDPFEAWFVGVYAFEHHDIAAVACYVPEADRRSNSDATLRALKAIDESHLGIKARTNRVVALNPRLARRLDRWQEIMEQV